MMVVAGGGGGWGWVGCSLGLFVGYVYLSTSGVERVQKLLHRREVVQLLVHVFSSLTCWDAIALRINHGPSMCG